MERTFKEHACLEPAPAPAPANWRRTVPLDLESSSKHENKKYMVVGAAAKQVKKRKNVMSLHETTAFVIKDQNASYGISIISHVN